MADVNQKAVRIAKVRRREEKRLLLVAKKAGLFEWRLTTAQLEAILCEGLDALAPAKKSQLSRLEIEMAKAKKGQSEEARKEEEKEQARPIEELQ